MMQEDAGSAAIRVKSAVGFGGMSFSKVPLFLMGALLIVLIVCWPAAPVRAAGPLSFAPAVNYGTADGPSSVTTGDFNADGKSDMATANYGGANVSILLGNGNGTFGAAVNYGVGSMPFSVTTGDFNADGKTDLATANLGGANVSILLGNGNGTFGAAVNYSAGTTPISVTTGDFNADGKTDLATANYGGANVSILLGNGNGTFGAAVNYGVGSTPFSVTTGDFNADGKTDLATANNSGNNVSILLGNGNGTFGAAVNYDGVGSMPRSVTTGDFNADGKTDLATANYGGANVSILLGNGNGTFGAAVNYGVGADPGSVATGDFNADGKTDLSVASNGTSNVSILINTTTLDPSGAFEPAVNYAAGTTPFSVTTGDFNADGKTDLATANIMSNNVSILLSNGNGTFGAAVNYGVGSLPRSVTTGDFNADGKTDLAVANLSSDNISILLGNGNGTFGAAVNYGVGTRPASVTTGDFNADGKTDLAVANAGSDNVSILLAVGDGTFSSAVNYAAGTAPASVTTGDFNRDGKTDLATANNDSEIVSNNVSILLGNGNGTFGAAVNYGVGTRPASVTTGDFNADGKTDLAAANYDGNNVSILINTAPNPPINYYWTWYDNIGGDNWIMLANPSSATGPVDYELSIAGTPKTLANGGVVAAGGQQAPRYNLVDGPVKVTSTNGQSALLSQRTLWPKGGNSLEEVLATEESKQSDHYYWTWYDENSPGYQDWILIANNNATSVFYEITIEGDSKETGTIAAGQKVTPHFPGEIGGPVEVQAWTDSGKGTPAKVMASQRVLSNYGKAFNEVPGTPATDLKSDYLWTWYDQVSAGATDWVLVANPSDTEVTYEIKIGGDPMPISTDNPGTIPAHGRVTPTFPDTIDGPVQVTASANVIASQRVIFGPSFEEVPGMSTLDLKPNYHWTWYDASAAGVSNWVLVANPSATEQIDYQILIAGDPQLTSVSNPGTILAGQRVTPQFPGQIGGPVEVRAVVHNGVWATPSDRRNIMSSQRVLWKGYFNEVLGTVLD